MFKEREHKQLNSSPLKPNSDIQIVVNRLDMLPTNTTPPTRTKHNHAKFPLLNVERLSQMPSKITIERCFFLLIHLLFYVIILTIVYVRLEQFSNKQERLLLALNSNDNNSTNHEPSQARLSHCNQ